MPINQVTGSLIEKYLNGLERQDGERVTARTVRNHFKVIKQVFRFAVRRKYLPKDALDELDVIELPGIADQEIEIYTPTEMREILSVARPELIQWIVAGGFCGVRTDEESLRTDVSRIQFPEAGQGEGHIAVTGINAKTGARRLAPIPENAEEWLRLYVQKEGAIAPFANMPNQVVRLVKDINTARKAQAEKAGKAFEPFVWKRNALRHSFCSYRVALIKNVAQVSLEAGNSPQVIDRHYLKRVTEAEAREWFAIRPAENIVALPQSTAAAS